MNRYQAVWSCDSGARVAMVRNGVEHSSLIYLDYPQKAIDPTAELHPLGMAAVIDGSGHPHLRMNPIEIDAPFRPQPKARPTHGYLVETPKGICTVCSPLFPLISSVFYRIAGFDGLVIFPLLGGLAAVMATYITAKRLGMRSASILALCMAFATPVVLYSTIYWDHSIHMGFTAVAAYCLVRTVQEKKLWWAVECGAALGAGVWFHELFIFLFVAVMVGSAPLLRAREYRKLVLGIAAGFALLFGAWIASNVLIYGSAGGTHALMPPELAQGLRRQMFNSTNFIARSASQLVGQPALYIHTIRTLVLLVAFFIATAIGSRVRWVAYGILLILAKLFYDQVQIADWASGLFQATPLLIPALAPPRSAESTDDETRTPDEEFFGWIYRAALGYIAIVLINPIDPALNWGSRYLLTALPLLALLAARKLETDYLTVATKNRWAVGACVAAVAIVSLLSQRRGYRAIEKDLIYSHELNTTVASTRAPAVVTDLYWLGAELTPSTKLPPVYLIRDSEESRGALRHALDTQRMNEFVYFGNRDGFNEISRAFGKNERDFKPRRIGYKCGRYYVRFSRSQPQIVTAASNFVLP